MIIFDLYGQHVSDTLVIMKIMTKQCYMFLFSQTIISHKQSIDVHSVPSSLNVFQLDTQINPGQNKTHHSNIHTKTNFSTESNSRHPLSDPIYLSLQKELPCNDAESL